MNKTFKEYEKENTIICPNCHIQIKTNIIPMSIFDNIHEDMYISHEDEYLERKTLQQRIDKAIEYTNELITDTKGMLDNMKYQDKEETITRFVEDLEKDIKNYEYQISILRGKDNE